MTRGVLAWLAVAAGLALAALAGSLVPPEAIDWQPSRALDEPWRAFSAIGVHYSARHLGMNLAGLALTATLGAVARGPARLAWAWLAAWPLTQLGLAFKPELAHYGGLSGVLHAGVAIVATFLVAAGTRAQRAVGGALLLGLCAKVAAEAPWGPALRHPAGWDIATAPFAHLTGTLAGAAMALVALRLPRRSRAVSNHA